MLLPASNTCTTFSVELRASNPSRFFVIDRLIWVASLRRRDYPGLLESRIPTGECLMLTAKPNLWYAGRVSSTAMSLQYSRAIRCSSFGSLMFIAWRKEEMWDFSFHIKSLRKEVETLGETCIICNFIFSTSAARACDILLCLSACLSLVKNLHYRDPAWWMWTYVAVSTNRLSLLLSGARKFQLSFLLLRTPVLSRVGRQPSSTIARPFFAWDLKTAVNI